MNITSIVRLCLALLCCLPPDCIFANDDLLIIRDGDLPILITAPHGGRLELQDVPVRTGDGLKKGPSGFFAGRDTGTEELAVRVVELLDQQLPGSPSCVISRVHRKYVDFNRPPEIAVEHSKAREVYDSFHHAARSSVNRIRMTHSRGLLVDIHGQGSSAATAYRGTSNGVTVEQLRRSFGEAAHTGEQSLMGLLAGKGWKVHPDPGTGREQAGFTGGFIVRTYGSSRADGIDAIQLELGIDYRRAEAREKSAEVLAGAIIEWGRRYLALTPETDSSGTQADNCRQITAGPDRTCDSCRPVIRHHCQNSRICRGPRLISDGTPPDFHPRSLSLQVPFNQQQITVPKCGGIEQLITLLPSQFPVLWQKEGCHARRQNAHSCCPRHPVTPRVFSRDIQLVVMMSVFDRTDLQATFCQQFDQFTDQRGFARVLFPDNVNSRGTGHHSSS